LQKIVFDACVLFRAKSFTSALSSRQHSKDTNLSDRGNGGECWVVDLPNRPLQLQQTGWINFVAQITDDHLTATREAILEVKPLGKL